MPIPYPFVPKKIMRHFADPYIAGETLKDGVETTKRLNKMGICATMDVLGESISRKEEAQKAVQNYLLTLDAIKETEVDANISIKPTQLGLGLDFDFWPASRQNTMLWQASISRAETGYRLSSCFSCFAAADNQPTRPCLPLQTQPLAYLSSTTARSSTEPARNLFPTR